MVYTHYTGKVIVSVFWDNHKDAFVDFLIITTVSLNVTIRTSSLSRLLICAFFYLLTLGIFTTNTKGTKNL